MTIAVLATLTVGDAHADAVRTALVTLSGAARDEPGTELFAVHEATDQPGRFVVFERYADRSAVNAHRTSAAMGEFRAALLAVGVTPDITFLTPLTP